MRRLCLLAFSIGIILSLCGASRNIRLLVLLLVASQRLYGDLEEQHRELLSDL